MTLSTSSAISPAINPDLGVIEGFFGRAWSWPVRRAYADFLARAGYGFYLYAPKNDPWLRRRWQEDWPADTWDELLGLRQAFTDQGIAFGLGLSPFEIHLNPDPESRAALKQRLRQINRLQPDILCLLFDDMRGDLPDLARIQTELVHMAAEETTARRVIFCPSYYSLDPVLEKVFGQRPANYWEYLGNALDPAIDIFWTGPQVCSTEYPREHLQAVSQLLQRRPFLWDNYPVNDGAAKSRHLQLRAFGKGHAHLAGQVAGHAVNPMNQAWLSRIPLLSLPGAYALGDAYDPQSAFINACQASCSPALAAALVEDVGLFQDLGLGQLTGQQRQHLRLRYQNWAPTEASAQEVCDWLDGAYTFDPACLTD